MNITKTIKLVCADDLPKVIISVRNFNVACNWLSSIAFSEKIWHWYPLQQRTYKELRERFNLSSAPAKAAIRKVTYAYSNKERRNHKVSFRPLGAMSIYRHTYKRDSTIRFYGFRVPFVCENGVILSSKCEAKLCIRKNKVILLQPVEVPEPHVDKTDKFLGVDLGVVNIATDSDGETFSGSHINGLRRRHNRLRARLQSKGTQSAHRLLHHRSGRESRFARCVNHGISKKLVAKAHGSGRGIAIEDLSGIRDRIKARRAQRGILHSWSFQQLRSFIEYKARLKGVPVVTVNPRNTSRTCPECGHISKSNRPTRDEFKCVLCGCAGRADHIAAEIISRAVGNQPYAESVAWG